jgi:hypothetical protein
VTLLACALAALLAAPGPARATDGRVTEAGPTERAQAGISVTELQRQIARNSVRIEVLAQEAKDAELRSRAAAADATEAQAELEAVQAQMQGIRAAILQRAGAMYRNAASAPPPLLLLRRPGRAVVIQKYWAEIDRRDGESLRQLLDANARLDARRRAAESARDEAAATGQRLLRERADLIDLLGRQKKLLDALGVIPVMGDAQLNAAQLAAWFRTTGKVARLAPGLTIDALAQLFIDEGRAEWVRGDVAFAQAILETGYFGSALDNNYAGIGACDSCSGEIAFPTPQAGVRAQIQFLRNYGDPISRASNLAHPLVDELHGGDAAADARWYDTFFDKGSAQTWNAMGNGHWATDPHYSTKVLGLYVRMVTYANGFA